MESPVAIVTGASSGIGKAFAERLAREGYVVYAVSRPSSHFDTAVRDWAAIPDLTAIQGDVTRDDDVKRIADQVRREHARLDLLINNAGAYFPEDGGIPPVEVLEQNLNINLLGQYRMILALLPVLERSPRPIILNVSSGAGALSAVNGPGPLGYRVSKAALNMLTCSLAMDLKDWNIAIHAVDPGYIRTRLNPDGTGTPEQAVDGMWPLATLHDLSRSGRFWHAGREIPW